MLVGRFQLIGEPCPRVKGPSETVLRRAAKPVGLATDREILRRRQGVLWCDVACHSRTLAERGRLSTRRDRGGRRKLLCDASAGVLLFVERVRFVHA